MRILLWAAVMLLFFGGQASAVALVSADSIEAAQEYGQNGATARLTDFFKPWTAYEEKAGRMDETTDRAYIYTPFLLLAADARDKTLKGQPVDPADGEAVLADYNGYLVFGLVLHGSETDFPGKPTVTLRQGRKLVKAQLTYLPDKPAAAGWPGGPPFVMQGYAYFAVGDIDANKPVLLRIAYKGKKTGCFYFDLARFR